MGDIVGAFFILGEKRKYGTSGENQLAAAVIFGFDFYGKPCYNILNDPILQNNRKAGEDR